MNKIKYNFLFLVDFFVAIFCDNISCLSPFNLIVRRYI